MSDLVVFIVDDDPDIAEAIAQVVAASGVRTVVYTHPRTALEAALEDPPDIIVVDQVMPDMMGTEFIRQIRMNRIFPPVIMCTGAGDAATRSIVEKLNVSYFEKPVDIGKLVAAINAFKKQMAG